MFVGNHSEKPQLFLVVVTVLALVACSAPQPTATPTAIPSPVPSSTPTPAPTSTPEPTNTPEPPTPQPTVDRQNLTDISYLPDWELDVRLPEEGDGLFPTILILHGATVTNHYYDALGDYFLERGYALVVPNWLTDFLVPSMFSPAFCALAWLHTNAETYGFDPDRVVVFGHSAGGWAAVMLLTVDDPTEFMQSCPYQLPASGWTRAVVTYGALVGTKEYYLSEAISEANSRTFFDYHAESFDLYGRDKDELRQLLMDTPYQGWRDITGLSPAATELVHLLAPTWVDGSEPPSLQIQGERDTGLAELEVFAAQLQAAGAEAEVFVVPNAEHETIMDSWRPGFDEACQAMEAFLNRVFE